MYRDGVGDSMLEAVVGSEVAAVRRVRGGAASSLRGVGWGLVGLILDQRL
jgi:hypothetical protein